MATHPINRLDMSEPDFEAAFARLLISPPEANADLAQTVTQIVAAVAREGDAALVRYTNELDRRAVEDARTLRVSADATEQALSDLSAEMSSALTKAAARIRGFHERQRAESWQYEDEEGSLLGQRVSALDCVGVYVPGGRASYPSSVLMNAIPAKVAGVERVVMVAPAPGGEINPAVLVAAALVGVDEVYTVGGAQAVAALAYGTATMPRVDKIVGPGNRFVAEAKRQVFGRVGIDMVAGPSEILILADGSVDPEWVAMDLFAQAEHDEYAQAVLISPDSDYLDAVEACISRLLPTLSRRDIVTAALKHRGALIRVPDIESAVVLSNRMAPEHLELALEDPDSVVGDIRAAGAIFMGAMSSEAVGDYCAGPNHVLPTAGSARFASPLGVYDFQRRSSLIRVSEQGAHTLGEIAAVLADAEGLEAHGLSAQKRMRGGD